LCKKLLFDAIVMLESNDSICNLTNNLEMLSFDSSMTETNMQDNISQKTLDKIKKDGLKPEPMWTISLKRGLLWFFFGCAIAAGGASLSAVIYLLKMSDWDLAARHPRGIIGFTAGTMPYFWILFSLLAAGAAFYEFRHTSRGYKQPFVKIAGLLILSSLAVGFGLQALNSGEALDELADSRIPLYHAMMGPGAGMWNRPGDGFLAGEVFGIASSGAFSIIDLNGKRWRMIPKNEVPVMRGCARIAPGSRLKIIGELKNEAEFNFEELRPYNCMHERMREMMRAGD
jgi:hypothetical protein